jgi:signal transduction histidine kinase
MENLNLAMQKELSAGNYTLIDHLDFEQSGYNQIISTISHELRTPVSILKSNIQILKNFSFNLDKDLKDESIFMCEESVENMVHFLDNIQLLNMAIKSGLVTVNSLFRVKLLTNSLSDDLAILNLDYRRVNVEWNLKDKVIRSDVRFLKQIVVNIVSNALKFSGDIVNLFISTKQNILTISVRDRGIGIPDEEKELVFNPFVRASNARKIVGTGLGLAIVNAVTKSFGGEIYLSSVVNEGTIITIILPYDLPNKDFGY